MPSLLPVLFPVPNLQCYHALAPSPQPSMLSCSRSQPPTLNATSLAPRPPPLWSWNEATVVPSLLEFSLCPLSPLLSDGVQVEEDETDEGEQDGWDRYQEPEGEGDCPGLLTQRLVVTH